MRSMLTDMLPICMYVHFVISLAWQGCPCWHHAGIIWHGPKLTITRNHDNHLTNLHIGCYLACNWCPFRRLGNDTIHQKESLLLKECCYMFKYVQVGNIYLNLAGPGFNSQLSQAIISMCNKQNMILWYFLCPSVEAFVSSNEEDQKDWLQ